MKEYQIIRPAERVAHGWVKHDILVSSGVDPRKFFDVRAGLTFPSDKSPGFFVIMGEEFYDSRLEAREGTGVLQLLDEIEYSDLSLHKFFDLITDSMLLHACRIVYCDKDKQKDYMVEFWEYCDSKKIKNISLIEGAYSSNFTLGLQFIEDANLAGLLRIPRTCQTYKAVENIPKTLSNNPETAYFELGTLRHVVASFIKYPPNREIPDFDGDYRDLGKDGWMAM